MVLVESSHWFIGDGLHSYNFKGAFLL